MLPRPGARADRMFVFTPGRFLECWLSPPCSRVSFERACDGANDVRLFFRLLDLHALDADGVLIRLNLRTESSREYLSEFSAKKQDLR